jgi:hypothetical protein
VFEKRIVHRGGHLVIFQSPELMPKENIVSLGLTDPYSKRPAAKTKKFPSAFSISLPRRPSKPRQPSAKTLQANVPKQLPEN